MSFEPVAQLSEKSGDNVVISATELGKCYHIYDQPSHRLLQGIVGHRKRYYRDFWAVRGVDLQVRRGETLGIIGRNGSGKSTLLQLIAGTLSPTEGNVAIHGRVAALLELGSGFNPDFTGRENVVLNATILGLTRSEIDSRLESILSFADIGSFIDQPVRNYSSGMVMRLAFSVMVHVDADILIIDEALAVGDAFFTQKCMRFLRDFQARGTLLFVSHDGGAVTGLCDRAIWLDHGKVRAHGAAKSVMTEYLEAFIAEREGGAGGTVSAAVRAEAPRVTRDVRHDLIDRSMLRNDIHVPPFDPSKTGFGAMAAEIADVVLLDEFDRRLPVICGGEFVTLEIVVAAHKELSRPIVGFYLKDRLGQMLFGDNTYLSFPNGAISAPAGSSLHARFSFIMPRLQAGDYFITAGVADGSQDEHLVQHWLHEALLLRSIVNNAPTGIIGIPMSAITLSVL